MKVLIGQQPWQEEAKDIKWECPYSWRETPFRTGTNALCMSCYSVASLCPTLSDPMDYSLPGPPSMGFSRQEYWSGVLLPSPLTAARHIYLELVYLMTA